MKIIFIAVTTIDEVDRVRKFAKFVGTVDDHNLYTSEEGFKYAIHKSLEEEYDRTW